MSWGASPAATEPSTHELLWQLRGLMTGLKTERLERVVATKPTDWSADRFVDEKGARCLTGHLEDWQVVKRRGKPSITQNLDPLQGKTIEASRVELLITFSLLCAKLGGPAYAAREVRSLALAELDRRKKVGNAA